MLQIIDPCRSKYPLMIHTCALHVSLMTLGNQNHHLLLRPAHQPPCGRRVARTCLTIAVPAIAFDSPWAMCGPGTGVSTGVGPLRMWRGEGTPSSCALRSVLALSLRAVTASLSVGERPTHSLFAFIPTSRTTRPSESRPTSRELALSWQS